MAALVAALLVQVSDRTPLTSAVLGTRHANTLAVVCGVVLALAIGNTLGAICGWLVAAHLSPNARDLFVALALLSAGGSALWPVRARAIPDRFGAFGDALVAVGLLGFGDRLQFITAALAMRGDVPALAAIGATIGAIAINVPAVVQGHDAVRRLPRTALRLGAAGLLIVVGMIQAMAALRLI